MDDNDLKTPPGEIEEPISQEPAGPWRPPVQFEPKTVTLTAGQQFVHRVERAPELWWVFSPKGWDGPEIRLDPGAGYVMADDAVELPGGSSVLLPGRGQILALHNPSSATVTLLVVAVSGLPFKLMPSGARLYGFDGTNWLRQRISSGGAVLAALGLLNADAHGNTPYGLLDLVGASRPLATMKYLFNGTTWDRMRNNLDLTLLASAARTTDQTVDFINYNHRGLALIINVTAAGAAPSVTPNLRVKDPVSGGYFTIWTGAALTAAGVPYTRAYLFYPGISGPAASLYTEDVDLTLPRNCNLFMDASNADSLTYSVAGSLIL